MDLENNVGCAEVQINEQDKTMVKMLMEHFRREINQRDGIEGVYYSLFSLHTAITLGAINPENCKAYVSVLSGEIPFYVKKGMVLSIEYYFDRQKGYKTRIRVFPKEAFNPLSVDGIRD